MRSIGGFCHELMCSSYLIDVYVSLPWISGDILHNWISGNRRQKIYRTCVSTNTLPKGNFSPYSQIFGSVVTGLNSRFGGPVGCIKLFDFGPLQMRIPNMIFGKRESSFVGVRVWESANCCEWDSRLHNIYKWSVIESHVEESRKELKYSGSLVIREWIGCPH